MTFRTCLHFTLDLSYHAGLLMVVLHCIPALAAVIILKNQFLLQMSLSATQSAGAGIVLSIVRWQ